MRDRLLAALLVLFAFGLRAAVSAQWGAEHPQADLPVIDEAAYERWALEVAGGDLVGSGVFFQEPLYPYALGALYAVTGLDRGAARLAHAALGALTALAVLLLARRLFGPAAGWVAGAAWALYGPALWMACLFLKPNVALPVVTFLALLVVGAPQWSRPGAGRRWLGVGALAGLAALLRGNVLVLLPLLVLWPLLRALAERRPWRGELRAAGAVLLGAGAVLLPVAARNAAVGGRFVLTTSGAGTNVYGGNSLANPLGVATEFPWVRGVPEHEAQDWRHEAERRVGRPLDATGTSRYWLGAALDSLAERPGAHGRILWNKLRLSLAAYEVPDNHGYDWDAGHVGLLALPWPGFGLVGGLGLAGLLWTLLGRAPARDRRAALEVAALFALYLATIVLTVTSARIRLLLVPLLLPFAAAACVGLVRLLRERDARGGLRLAAACLVGFVATLAPAPGAGERARDADEREFNLAVAELGAGRLDDARERLLALDRAHPGTPRVTLHLAEIDYRRARARLDAGAGADDDEARRGLARALFNARQALAGASPQEAFRLHVLAGAVLQYLGDWAGAGEHYDAALAFDREDRDVRRRRAVCLAELAVGLADAGAREERLREALSEVEALEADARDPVEARELAALARRLREHL